MNTVFLILILGAFTAAAAAELAGGHGAMEGLSAAMVDAAASAVPLALGLVGIMALFLGLMKVAEAGGLLEATARVLEPLLGRLFPEIPAGHPAMGAMVMNVAANLLGLGNAATPFGIRAMEHLEHLNPVKGTATNAQVLFLAINTAGLTVLPTKVIALRASLGSADPAAIIAPTLCATLVATLVAVVGARLLQRVWRVGGDFTIAPQTPGAPHPQGLAPAPSGAPTLGRNSEPMNAFIDSSVPPQTPGAPHPHASSRPLWPALWTLGGILALIPLLLLWGRQTGPWIMPLLVAAMLLFGALRKVAIYESFVEGAKEGFAVAVRIIPYLVAILVAIGMFRASGAMDMVIKPLGRLTEPLGLPAEALMMAVMRTLSGSGSYGLLAANLKDGAIGPDGYLGLLLSTIYGSTETTFYVLAVYFGAVQVKRIRHALAVGLLADFAALLTAVAVCRVIS